LRRLAKTEAGFGLIELLIAMSVMVIAIMAIVAAFSSGMVALNRASQKSTAATLADIQMEGFRKGTWGSIASAPGTPQPGPDGRTYRVESVVALVCPIATCAGPGTARLVKQVTINVYDHPATAPETELFSETSTFDQATG
jgi:Tfp pilus assembly protein PilV